MASKRPSKAFRDLVAKRNEATDALDTAQREASSAAGLTDKTMAYRAERLTKARARVEAANAALEAFPIEEM